jgi:hypothetical protein
MIGLELYIRDKDVFYCYKQSHDGYYITNYLSIKGDNIFNSNAIDIIHELHDNFFLRDPKSNYHGKGKPLEYGVEIPKVYVRDNDFSMIFNDINEFIETYYNDEDRDYNYNEPYHDNLFFVDLIDQRIEGSDKNENSDSANNSIEECGGCL